MVMWRIRLVGRAHGLILNQVHILPTSIDEGVSLLNSEDLEEVLGLMLLAT